MFCRAANFLIQSVVGKVLDSIGQYLAASYATYIETASKISWQDTTALMIVQITRIINSASSENARNNGKSWPMSAIAPFIFPLHLPAASVLCYTKCYLVPQFITIKDIPTSVWVLSFLLCLPSRCASVHNPIPPQVFLMAHIILSGFFLS